MIEIFHGNCLDIFPQFKEDQFNLVFTSPPYNMNLRIRNGKYCSRQLVKEISTKYTSYTDNLPIEEYYDFNKKIISECLRVSPLVFYNVQFLTGNKVALFRLIGEYAELLKEIIIWDKINCEPAIGELILNSQFEVILVFDKYNAISRKFIKGNFKRGELSNHWQIKRGKKVCSSHGASFPVELAEKIIQNFSHEGDSILDPMMGTGTTGEAARNLNRDFVGVELDKDYYDFSKERLIN